MKQSRNDSRHSFFFFISRKNFFLVLTLAAVVGLGAGGVLSRAIGTRHGSAQSQASSQPDKMADGRVVPNGAAAQQSASSPQSPSVVSCNSVSNTITCTGGQGASLAFPSNAVAGTTTNHAATYPATLAIPTGNGAGQIPAGATVQSISVQFNGLTAKNSASGCSGCGAARDMGVVLQSPGGSRSLQVMSRIGAVTASTVSNFTVKIQDGGATLPVNPAGWTSGGTFAPASYDGSLRDLEVSPDYTPTGPASPSLAAPLGTATMTSAFGGAVAAGTWNVYLADDGGRIGGGVGGADITFTSYDLIITYSAASTPSTTTLTRSLSTPFTSGANSTDTLTATITAGATGTVTFKDGGSNLTCAGGNPATISSNTATCNTTFSAEGLHNLSAVYSGDGTFVTSTGTANIFAMNHSANVGTTYCNTGSITSTGLSDAAFTATAPYPSVIFVGDGVNTSIPQTVSTVSLQLKNVSAIGGAMRMLLVSPDGKAYDFWDSVGAQPNGNVGNYVIQDGSPQPPQAPIAPGTYGPADISTPPSLFTPAPPVPAPQLPGTQVYAPPAGTSTFQTAFSGATSNGAWSLFYHNPNGNGVGSVVAGGWCITISPNTGQNTATTVTSSANPSALFGASTSFTATIASSPTANQGTVTFTENGNPLTGAPNGGVANVSAGAATIATTGLPEGDHTITATYHDASHTFNDSFGTVTIRIDKATSTPTLSGSTWSYCNTGAITIPLGQLGINDFGPASPNPSNIRVTNLPGRVSSVTLIMKQLHHVRPQNLETLLVGPNGGAAPTLAQTFDFFSLGGGINPFGPQDTTFGDAFATTPLNSPPPASTGPASYGATSYTASPFFTLPAGTVQHATTQGGFTFNTGTLTGSGGGVYLNKDPLGTWSMYFDQTANAIGSGLDGGWCLNFIETAVTGTGTTAHVGPAPSNHMRQGGTGSVTFSLLNNGNGPTGDPDQATSHAMTVTGTLPAGLTLGTVPTGSPWNCTANTTTNVTCTNLNATAQGSFYSLLTIPVNVAGNAAASVTISGFTFSGAGMTAGTFASDTITIDPAPILAVNKSHTGTFVNGHTAVWNIQVSNNSATAAGATDGSTVTVTDALPAGYTFASFTGTGWSCSGTTTVTCTSNAVVAGNGGTFNLLALTVNVAANSPMSVNNVATAFGGGDIVHTNLGTAVSSNTDTTAATNNIVWNGSASSDWNTAANWTPAVVPNSGNNASIPTGALPNEPSLSSSPDATVTDLTVASGASLTIGSTRTVTVNGNASVDGQILGSGAVQFGSGSHSLGGAGSFAATIAATLVSGATVTLTSNMQMGSVIINGGATLSLVSHTLSLSGTPTPLTINGTFNNSASPAGETNAASPQAPEAVGGTVLFNGAAAQNAPGITYSGLAINNSSGVTLSGNASVNLALTLTSGDLNTSSFTLTMPATATSSGSSDVVGNVSRTGFATAACPNPPCANTLSFGEPDNQITMTAGTTPTDITVNLVKSAPAGFSSAVQRTYTITPNPSNLSGFTATVRLHYLDSELNGNTPESSLSLRRFNGTGWVQYAATTPVDSVNNWVQNNAVQNFSPWTFSKLSPTAANGAVSGRIMTSDGKPVEGAVVNMSGGQTRKTITDANGNYRFDNVETSGFYAVTPARANYNFSPFNRTFSQIGNQTEAVFTADSMGDSANPLDTAEYFVRQQYVDVLGREPDEAGFNYWSDQMLACGDDASCTRARRTAVAAAFFISTENQASGSYIYDVYAGALGRRPAFNEYALDRQQVVGGDTLDATKAAFAQGFVQRAEFTAKYQDGLTAESFVDALIQTAQSSGGNLNDGRANLISIYNQAGGDLITSRAAVVRSLADNAAFKQSQYNQAFVLTEYFAYLHRNIDQGGYDFWVNVLNNGDRGNYRGMVCSFITSTEYQRRFSAVVSRSNGECGN